MSELNDFFKQLSDLKAADPVTQKNKKIESTVKENLKEDFSSLFAELSSLKKRKEEIIQEHPQLIEEVLIETKPISTPVGEIPVTQQSPSIVDLPIIDKYLKSPQFDVPDVSESQREIQQINKKMKFLEQWIGKINNAGPGSGEVNLRYLDDVARETISDGLYLRYNASTKKFMFDHGHQNAFYGAFESTQTQTCGASTASALTYNQVDFSYGVTVVDNSKVTIEHPGLYNAQFSVQLINENTQIETVYIWLRQNGADVAGSTGKIDITSSHGGTHGALLVGWNFYINTTSPNEYFEFMWFAPNSTHVSIPNLPAQNGVAGVSPYIPGTASVVLTVSPVKIN